MGNYHRSGRAETYHLGAHPPSFTPNDLDLIHRIWLDAATLTSLRQKAQAGSPQWTTTGSKPSREP